MKKSLLTALIAGSLLSHFPVFAQEDNGCFMLDDKGKTVNLGSLCGSNGTGTITPNPTNSTPGVFKVPIKRRQQGIPVINVVFNRQHTFEMMLDTGASGTVVTPAMAQVLQVRQEGVVRASTAGGEILAPIGYVGSVEVAGLKVDRLLVGIAPIGVGLLGQDFYSEYDVIIRRDVIEFHHR